MFLERLGKLCFSHMRPSLFYLLLASPILVSSVYLIVQSSRLSDLEEQFLYACKKGEVALTRKRKKDQFLNRYSRADPYFLNQQIESLAFLQQERQELEKLQQHPALADKHLSEERLAFIKGDENRLAFTEESIRATAQIKETEEEQRHPIEIDEEDLKKLLCFLEDIPIHPFSPPENRPQIIITDLLFEKKTTPLQTRVLQLEMKLLTREFSK